MWPRSWYAGEASPLAKLLLLPPSLSPSYTYICLLYALHVNHLTFLMWVFVAGTLVFLSWSDFRVQSPFRCMGVFLSWYTTLVLPWLLLSASSSCPLILHPRDPVSAPQRCSTAPGLKTPGFARIPPGPTISLPSLYLANRTAKPV